MKDFRGKIIWITGGSSGIGREMALQSNALGATVVLSARNSEELEKTRDLLPKKENSLILPLDMQKQQEFPQAAETIVKKFGRIDLLFNNAGISQRAPVRETSNDVDRKLMEVNFFGTIFLTKAVLPYMQKQGGGHIAVVSSLAGKFGFYQRSAYSASKHALHGYFESLALEEFDNKIKVSLLCPSGVKTNISRNALDARGEKFGQMSELQEKGISAKEAVKAMIEALKQEKQEVLIGSMPEKLSNKIKVLLPRLFWQMLRRKEPKAN